MTKITFEVGKVEHCTFWDKSVDETAADMVRLMDGGGVLAAYSDNGGASAFVVNLNRVDSIVIERFRG